MDMRKLVGRNFARLRREKQFTQERFAEVSGVTQQYVSGLERGQRNPTIVTLYHIATALGVSHVDLLLSDGEVGREDGKQSRRKPGKKQSTHYVGADNDDPARAAPGPAGPRSSPIDRHGDGTRRGKRLWPASGAQARRPTPTPHWQSAYGCDICFQGLGRILEFSVPTNQTTLMTANDAASVTGVPLRQVHRIIDAGLLGGAVKRRHSARLLAPNGLVGLRLAHETADVLTLQSRRAVVATAIRSPRQAMIRADVIVVDARPAARAVRSGLSLLAKARGVVSSTPGVLGGTPVFKGTRIPVHDIADMLANGDRPAAIIKAFPQLDADR